MSNMTIKQMEDAVKSYIDDDFLGEYRYALMLNGNWGSGKTYFIQKNIINSYITDSNTKDQSIKGVYISLNGLKNKNEITSSIMSGIASARAGKAVLWVAGITIGLLSDLAKTHIGGNTSESIEETLKHSSFSKNEFFFAFDDLERCLMPLEESLGFISSFVEQYKAKVIILANEEEIKNGFAQRMNYYQLAVNKDLKINLDDSEKKKSDPPNRDNSIDILNLPKRAEKVSEVLGTYNQIKEKVVGITIDFSPSVEERIETVLDHSLKEPLNSLMPQIKEKTCSIMQNSKHTNVRTLLFSIVIFNKLAQQLSKYQKCEEYTELAEQLFYMVLRVSIRFKSGKPDVDWTPFEKMKAVQYNENLYEFNYSLKVVHDMVYRSSKEEEIQKALEFYYNTIVKYNRSTHELLTTIAEFRSLNDKEVEHSIECINQKLNENCFQPSDYKTILRYFCTLYEIGFESANPDRCLPIMKKFIKEQKITELYIGRPPQNDTSDYELYARCIQGLKSACDEVIQTQQDSIAELIRKEVTGEPGWWGKLCEELDQKNREGIIYNCMFDYCTVEQWSEAIVKSESKDLSGLVRHFRNVKKDLADPARAGELARQLKKDLAELPAPVDKIRKYNIENLIEILKQPAE